MVPASCELPNRVSILPRRSCQGRSSQWSEKPQFGESMQGQHICLSMEIEAVNSEGSKKLRNMHGEFNGDVPRIPGYCTLAKFLRLNNH